MARGLFVTGFTGAEVLSIQQQAKDLLLEDKTIMNWSDAESWKLTDQIERCSSETGGKVLSDYESSC